jgi:hypothetical protein
MPSLLASLLPEKVTTNTSLQFVRISPRTLILPLKNKKMIIKESQLIAVIIYVFLPPTISKLKLWLLVLINPETKKLTSPRKWCLLSSDIG